MCPKIIHVTYTQFQRNYSLENYYMARLDFHALNVVTWLRLGKHSICGNNHKLVKVFTITSFLINVLNRKISLPLYHAMYFISFIATAVLLPHSPLNCAISHVYQCPCQRKIGHLTCNRGKHKTNHVTLIWKLQ